MESTQIVLVKDINPGTDSSYPLELTEFEDKVYFTAKDEENGRELWISDGTSEGTQLVKDINPGTENSFIIFSSVFNDVRFSGNFTEFKDKIYFIADNGDDGRELWVSNGTSAGTQIVKDINPGSDNGFSYYLNEFVELNGKLYFVADNGEIFETLWVTDGTTSGTQLVVDVNPGSNDSFFYNVDNLTEVDGKLYFSASDGINRSGLWVSDGTAAGTQSLTDILPADVSFIRSFTEAKGKLYFVANDGENGSELWITDGTESGTNLVKDINPGSGSVFPKGRTPIPFDFTEFDNKLYFVADNGENGNELWVSDGTSEGTQLVKDIFPGIGYRGLIPIALSSTPLGFTEVNEKLYFAANSGENGRELWVTDGTSDGTVLVADIEAGGRGSYPSDLTEFNGELYFSARNEENGSELFKLAVEEPINIIAGTNSADRLVGTDENDRIEGKKGNDTLFGAEANDLLFGDRGNDKLFGSIGNDSLNGGRGRDILNGERGNDKLFGDRGNDNLFGSIGDDTLDGGSGDDTLNGGIGNDTLTGGTGSDTFILKSNRGLDTITDFDLKVDRISLAGGLKFDDLIFSGNRISAKEEILAILDGVNTTEISEDVFEQFEL